MRFSRKIEFRRTKGPVPSNFNSVTKLYEFIEKDRKYSMGFSELVNLKNNLQEGQTIANWFDYLDEETKKQIIVKEIPLPIEREPKYYDSSELDEKPRRKNSTWIE